jgi:L-lactate dehydrogenase complex protein LldG
VGLTGANGALVDSGTLALVSGPGRGRLASLLPPVHIALVARNKLYPSLPAFLKTHPNVTAEGSNLILITGPSRTGDIEMTLTMGVHGPGEIHVIITP